MFQSKDKNLSSILSLSGLRKNNGQAISDMHADNYSQPANKQLIEQIHILIEEQPEFLNKEDLLKKLAHTKYKEIMREVLAEDQRRGNYLRIYPAYGTDVYDKYFTQQRPFNRYIYKMLFTDYLGLERE